MMGGAMTAKGENGDPPEPVETGDFDPQTGQFLPGNRVGKLGGRPPKPDFHKLVRLRAERDGITQEQAWLGLLDKLWEIAESNAKDRMQAMKILVDQGFGAAAPQVKLEIDNRSGTINIAAQGLEDFKGWVGKPETQATMLDELERRTLGDGD